MQEVITRRQNILGRSEQNMRGIVADLTGIKRNKANDDMDWFWKC